MLLLGKDIRLLRMMSMMLLLVMNKMRVGLGQELLLMLNILLM